ncbi:MAG: ATP-binding protein [Candidatus Geothermincolia bacterium]
MAARHSGIPRGRTGKEPAGGAEFEGVKEKRGRVLSEEIATRQLAREETLIFRRVADNAAEGIAVTDNDMRLIYTNRAFNTLYGLTPSEMIGRNPLEFGLGPGCGEALGPQIESSFEDHGAWTNEITIERPDGTAVQVLVSASNLKDDRGNTAGRVATLTDVSDIKWVEARLREVNAALDSYAQTVSHDLRSPLTAIVMSNQMMIEALARGDPRELRDEVAECTASIARNLDKAYKLINDLLSLAESGQRPMKASYVKVTGVVKLVLEEHAGTIRDKGVKVVCDPDFGTVRASETHIYQLFSNLIGNGIRHNDNPIPVLTLKSLGTTREGAHRYLMSDNSSGISDEDMGSIFKPLYHGQRGTGKGLGLAIVRRIVDVYGGALHIYNDDGACFEFELRDVSD